MPKLKRGSTQTLERLIDHFPVIGLTGARQVGKTTLIRHLQERGFDYVSLDDPFEREQAFFDPGLFLTKFHFPLIIDEIQHVPALLDLIKLECDQLPVGSECKTRFVMSGSQHFRLMETAEQSLAGRMVTAVLPPFSLLEVRTEPPLSPIAQFRLACESGLFPGSYTLGFPESRYWFGAYLQTYLERDVRTLYGIQNLMVFQRFVRLLASQAGKILNFAYLANQLDLSVNTIKRWVQILQAGHMVILLPAYYQSFGRRIIQAPKLYFSDIGLLCYLLGLQKINPDHPMFGLLFENFCIQEISKYFWIKGQEPRLYYFRTTNGLEISTLMEVAEKTYSLSYLPSTTYQTLFEKKVAKINRVFPKDFDVLSKVLYLGQCVLKKSSGLGLYPIDQFLTFLNSIEPKTG